MRGFATGIVAILAALVIASVFGVNTILASNQQANFIENQAIKLHSRALESTNFMNATINDALVDAAFTRYGTCATTPLTSDFCTAVVPAFAGNYLNTSLSKYNYAPYYAKNYSFTTSCQPQSPPAGFTDSFTVAITYSYAIAIVGVDKALAVKTMELVEPRVVNVNSSKNFRVQLLNGLQSLNDFSYNCP